MEQIEQSGLIIEICQDENPDSPRENDNVGTMVCWHNRYKLGDKHDFQTPQDFNEWKNLEISTGEDFTILPLYLYDHSGITMSVNQFSCPWDSGQVGWIFVTKSKLKKEKIDIKRAEDILRAEVEEYDKYLTGDVWGYVIKDGKNVLGSCWGFYDKEYMLEEAKTETKTIAENLAIGNNI